MVGGGGLVMRWILFSFFFFYDVVKAAGMCCLGGRPQLQSAAGNPGGKTFEAITVITSASASKQTNGLRGDCII